MKLVTLKITTSQRGDYVPPQAGDTAITAAEENIILDSVEKISPESQNPDDEDTMELTTEAHLSVDSSGRYTIAYEESELSGMEGTKTTITFLDNDRGILTILREGAVNSTLVLQKGKFHTGLYETPVMPLDITTMTYKLENKITENGGHATADYSLRIGGVTTTRTQLTIQVTEQHSEAFV